jgi:hypothetical protein
MFSSVGHLPSAARVQSRYRREEVLQTFYAVIIFLLSACVAATTAKLRSYMLSLSSRAIPLHIFAASAPQSDALALPIAPHSACCRA